MPHKTIGILGSGQLGRMLVIAASQLGLRTHVYAPDAHNSPAGEIAHKCTEAEYYDLDALAIFGGNVDAVTTEFENVPSQAMTFIAKYCVVSPGPTALQIAQNRFREKTLARELGIKTPRFWQVSSNTDLIKAMDELNGEGILKTCELGYDGKGQVRVSANDDFVASFDSLNTNDAILEEMISFHAEASFLVARGTDGTLSRFPPSLNEHKNGILSSSIAPANLPDAVVDEGQAAVTALAEALDVIGLLALETFVTRDNRLLFNEIAPRPHNSFHWTIEGCETSQFTQLIRAVAGIPLGGTSCYGTWLMKNIFGEDMSSLKALADEVGLHIHLYGKAEAKTGRKMGHTNQQVTHTNR